MPENEIGINRDDSLPGKGKYAVYGTYDRIRRIDGAPLRGLPAHFSTQKKPPRCRRRNHNGKNPIPRGDTVRFGAPLPLAQKVESRQRSKMSIPTYAKAITVMAVATAFHRDFLILLTLCFYRFTIAQANRNVKNVFGV